MVLHRPVELARKTRHLTGGDFTSPVNAFERSRPAADATREVVERWLLYGL